MKSSVYRLVVYIYTCIYIYFVGSCDDMKCGQRSCLGGTRVFHSWLSLNESMICTPSSDKWGIGTQVIWLLAQGHWCLVNEWTSLWHCQQWHGGHAVSSFYVGLFMITLKMFHVFVHRFTLCSQCTNNLPSKSLATLLTSLADSYGVVSGWKIELNLLLRLT